MLPKAGNNLRPPYEADVLDVVSPSGKIDKWQKGRQSPFKYDGDPYLNPLPH
jgi:hypothetical protein